MPDSEKCITYSRVGGPGPPPPRSYISVRELIVSLSQYDYIKKIAKRLRKADFKLFCYILACTLKQYRQLYENSQGWIAIPSQFIQAKFRTAKPENLAYSNLIDIDWSYYPGKRSRQYRLKDEIIEGYLEASTPGDRDFVNLLTGKPPEVLGPSSIPTEVIDATPPLILEAIKCFDMCWFNREAVLKHLEHLKTQYTRNKTRTNLFRYRNDRVAFDAIDKLSFPHPDYGPKVYAFHPPYRVLTTGRISTLFQSCTRQMKQAAFGSIPGVINYDLSSSQISLCLEEMRKYGIECFWLQDYLAEGSKRQSYARYIGISKDTWKTCLCAVVMTGHLPTNTKWKNTAIIEALKSEISDALTLEDTLKRLREVLQPVLRQLQRWHSEVDQQAKETGYIVNAVGMRKPYQNFKSKGEIIAFILQGLEAYFIHTLTTLGIIYDFKPLSNEHDGLITFGEVPIEAIEEVKRLTGLHCLELRKKPFV